MQIGFHAHDGHQIEGGKEPIQLENSFKEEKRNYNWQLNIKKISQR
jgi:hypothetical protein